MKYVKTLKNLEQVHLSFILVILISFFISMLFNNGIWTQYAIIMHTLSETICIFIALSIFIIVWHNYKVISPNNSILGFGFLIIAFFDIFHVLYFSMDSGSNNLTGWYWLLGRYIEALMLLVVSISVIKVKINKYLGLGLSFIVSIGITMLIFYFPQVLPILLTSEGFTPTKAFLELFKIIIILYCLYKMVGKFHKDDFVDYEYIILALLIIIPTYITFSIYAELNSFNSIFGHLLKISYYYFLFKGIFVGAITYPFEIIQETNRNINTILNGLPMGVITYDNALKVSFINKEAEKLIGRNKEEILGSSQFSLGNILDTREIDNIINNKINEEFKIKENTIITLKHSENRPIKLKTTVIVTNNNTIMLLINDAKKEQELNNLQLQTQTVLNSTNSLVVIMSKNFEILTCNRAFEEVLGKKHSDIVGLNWEQLVLQFQARINTINEKNDCKIIELNYISGNNELKEVVAQMAPIINLDSEIVGYIVVGSDVTEIKRRQQIINQQEKLAVLGQMAASIVHEIKNPLTIIKGLNQILLKNVNDKKVRDYLCIIENEVNNIVQFANDFLSYSRPSLPKKEKVYIKEIINSMKIFIEPQCRSKNVDLKIKINSDFKVSADKNQLKQVLLNIIQNAIDAMSETPKPKLHIFIDVLYKKKEICISIVDNGKGMDSSQLKKIGTPFYTTKENGTGLGLNFCHQIVREHDGRIEVNSTPGVGTCFKIFIPILEEQINYNYLNYESSIS